jgi:hypothetical protein
MFPCSSLTRTAPPETSGILHQRTARLVERLDARHADAPLVRVSIDAARMNAGSPTSGLQHLRPIDLHFRPIGLSGQLFRAQCAQRGLNHSTLLTRCSLAQALEFWSLAYSNPCIPRCHCTATTAPLIGCRRPMAKPSVRGNQSARWIQYDGAN